MKYLLVLAVVWIAFLLWRQARRADMQDARPPAPPPPAVAPPQDMARCAHCGLHLPAADALPGPGGKLYCSPAHRQAGEA